MTMLLALLLAQIAGTPGQIQTPNAGRWTSQQGTFLQDGTGAGLRTIETKLREVVSVKDFKGTDGVNCRGDGSHDDTSCIQAAVNYVTSSVATLGTCSTLCPPNSGGSAELFFPTGLYIVTDTITITGTASLRGDASELTYTGARIKQNTCGKDLFLVAGESTVGAASLQFVNLALMAKSTCAATFVAGTALVHVPSTVTNAASIYFRGDWFQTPEDYAINAETGDDYAITDCTFDVSTRKALKFGSATKQVTNSMVARNYFFFIDLGLVDLVNVARWQFVGNRVGGRDTPRTGYMVDCLNTSPVACDSVVIDHNVSLYANGLYLTKFGTANVTGNIARLANSPLVQFGGGGIVSNVIISSNNLSGTFGVGSAAIEGAGASVQYSAFVGNSLSGTDGTGSTVNSTPILLTNGGNVQLTVIGNENFGFTNAVNATGTSVHVEYVDLNNQQSVAGMKTFTGNGTNPGVTSIGGSGGAPGATFTGTGGNAGATATGQGSGAGFSGTGGGTAGAHGVDGTGGASGGRGVVGTGTGGWEGVVGVGNLTAAGGSFVGTSTGPAVQTSGSVVDTRIVLTYSATIATNASLGNVFSITVTNGTAFTISSPTNPLTGQRLAYIIRNTSGGAHGLITWGAAFKTAAAALTVTTAFSKTIEFVYDGTNWVEVFRSAADVAN
jgi:hypothetical protein